MTLTYTINIYAMYIYMQMSGIALLFHRIISMIFVKLSTSRKSELSLPGNAKSISNPNGSSIASSSSLSQVGQYVLLIAACYVTEIALEKGNSSKKQSKLS